MDINEYLTIELRDFYRSLPTRATPSGIPKSIVIESDIQIMSQGEAKQEIRKLSPIVGGANSATNSNALGPG